MNHYCTYFDRGYLAVGLALWDSLRRFDPAAELSVLALDDDTAAVLRQRGESGLRTLVLAELERQPPDFLFSYAVVKHVSPRGLDTFLRPVHASDRAEDDRLDLFRRCAHGTHRSHVLASPGREARRDGAEASR